MICRAQADGRPARFVHDALFYRGTEELAEAIGGFVEQGTARGEPAIVLLPGAAIASVRTRLGSAGELTSLRDIAQLGRNPARLLPALSEWVAQHPGPVRMVVEAMWAGREADEVEEVNRHESLVNLAFAEVSARSLCVYDAGQLPGSALAGAERTHPRVIGPRGEARTSRLYVDPRSDDQPAPALSAPPEPVQEIAVTEDLGRVRRQIGSSPAIAALSRSRREDFVLAANEAAINALEYGREPRRLRLWRSEDAVVAEVTGRGGLDDPLAGRRRPAPGAVRGRGLWLVNQVCDLVQLRSRAGETTLRMHMRFA